MKYSSFNLVDPPVSLPLKFPIKLIIDYRPGGVLADSAPVVYSSDPEKAADDVVKQRGWGQSPQFDPIDVWVTGAI